MKDLFRDWVVKGVTPRIRIVLKRLNEFAKVKRFKLYHYRVSMYMASVSGNLHYWIECATEEAKLRAELDSTHVGGVKG